MSRQRAPKTYYREPLAVMCLHCAEPVEDHPDGRPRRYCSDRCRVAAFRARSKADRKG